MRTRSNRRTSWFDSPPSFSGDRSSRTTRRRHSTTPPDFPEEIETQPAQSTFAHAPSAPLLSPDAILRNVAFVALVGTLALMFLNVALYVGVVAVGVLVPAWRTFKTLERPADPIEIVEIDGDLVQIPSTSPGETGYGGANLALRNWHKYWILATILFTTHAFVGRPFITAVIPVALYRVALLSLLSWMNANHGANSAHVYDTVVKPALIKSEHAIDVCVESALGQIDYFTRQVILAVNQVVEPYARQLEHAAEVTRRQMEEQSHRRNIPGGYFD